MILLATVTSALAAGLDQFPSLVGPGADQGCVRARPAGDLDGDGLGDLVVGCPYDDRAGHEAGAVYLVTEVALIGPLAPLVDAGEALVGEDVQDQAGRELAAMGDLDRDGRDDLVVAAPEASTELPAVGKVYVVLSPAGGELGDHPWRAADEGWERAGTRVINAGDVDEDGTDDLLVGAPYPTPGGNVGVGWLTLHYGDTLLDWAAESEIVVEFSGTVNRSNASAAWVFFGSGALVGRSGALAWDVDGDGLGELVVGAPGWQELEPDDAPESGLGYSGTAFVYASRSRSEQNAVRIESEDEAIAVIGGDVDGDELPWILATTPDDRLLMTAPQADGGAGVAWLVDDLVADDLVGSVATSRYAGRDAGTLLGYAAAPSLDLVLDGVAALGEPGYDGAKGRVVVVDGQPGTWSVDERTVAELEGCWSGGQAGLDLAVATTLDPRGGADVTWMAVVVPGASVNAPHDGLVVLVHPDDLSVRTAACQPEAPNEVVDVDGDGVPSADDCDDAVAWVYPGAPEVCSDGVDDDCDGVADEACGEPVDPARCAPAGGAASGLLALLAGVALGRRRRSP